MSALCKLNNVGSRPALGLGPRPGTSASPPSRIVDGASQTARALADKLFMTVLKQGATWRTRDALIINASEAYEPKRASSSLPRPACTSASSRTAANLRPALRRLLPEIEIAVSSTLELHEPPSRQRPALAQHRAGCPMCRTATIAPTCRTSPSYAPASAVQLAKHRATTQVSDGDALAGAEDVDAGYWGSTC